MLFSLLLAMAAVAPDLRLEVVRESLAGTHYRYRQYAGGSPVVGGEVNVTIRPDGRREEARAVAAVPPHASAIRGGVWVNVDGQAFLTRREVIHDRHLVMLRYIDLDTGATVREELLSYNAKPASIFEANPVVKLDDPDLRDMEDSATAVPGAAYSIVELPRVNESGPLGGPAVQIKDFQLPNVTPADSAGPFLFNREDDGFEDVNAYFHIDQSQQHLQWLGYTGVRQLVPYAVETDTHAAGGTDNSFFVILLSAAGRGRLHFGEGGTDDAEDSDLVVHEYAHAIHEWISPSTFLGSFESEARAIGEGFGDYWALSAKYQEALASGRDPFCFADWDVRCWTNPPGDRCAYPPGTDCLRRLDSPKTMADYAFGNNAGTEHRNGAIWSSALREIYIALTQRYGLEEGRRISDTLVLESFFGTPPTPTFASMARQMIGADRYISGGRNSDVICSAMTRRGILGDCLAMPRGELTYFPGRGSGTVVPDNDPQGIELSVFVSDPRTIEKVMLSVDIEHRGRGELRLALVGPDGTTARLYQPNAERAPDLVTTFGRDSIPVDSLDVFRGRSAAGEWRLRIVDAAFADLATIRSWNLIIQFAGDEPASERGVASERQVIPVVGHTPGANGTFFRSDVRMLNRGTRETEVVLTFTPSTSDGRITFGAVKVIVGPGESAAFDDVVRTIFATRGTGQLEIAGDVLASARTYTISDEGTFGLFSAAIDVDDAVSPSWIVHLRNDDAFRSNIGFAEVSGNPARVVIELHSATGQEEIFSHELLPFSHLQVPVEMAGEQIYARVTVEGMGRVIAYGATVDNRSGDPIFIPAASGPPQTVAVIPAISSGGLAGTYWRTEYVVTPLAEPSLQSQTFMAPSGQRIERSVEGSSRFDDVLPELFGVSDTRGTITRGVMLTPAIVSARIWTHGPNGTYGQFVPFGEPSLATIRHILHVENSDDYRTNIGLIALANVSVRVTIYSADGDAITTSVHHLRPYELEQFQVLAGVTHGYAVIEGGADYAYGSVVDNRTGDPIFVPGR
jgi:zinc metalloprotease ZmpB